MGDARRFLRYLMPGAVYGIETLFLLWIICPVPGQKYVLDPSGKDSLIGIVLGSVIVFSALGYIFSSIHHACHWLSNEECDEIDKILDHKVIAYKISTEKVKNSLDAMAISYAHWYQQMANHKIGNAAEQKVHSLGDQAHGLGTARIASIFALPTTLAIALTSEAPICGDGSVFRIITMYLLWMYVTWTFHCGYRRVGKIAHETYKRILLGSSN